MPATPSAVAKCWPRPEKARNFVTIYQGKLPGSPERRADAAVFLPLISISLKSLRLHQHGLPKTPPGPAASPQARPGPAREVTPARSTDGKTRTSNSRLIRLENGAKEEETEQNIPEGFGAANEGGPHLPISPWVCRLVLTGAGGGGGERAGKRLTFSSTFTFTHSLISAGATSAAAASPWQPVRAVMSGTARCGGHAKMADVSGAPDRSAFQNKSISSI